jgi:ribonuclease HII
MRWGRSSVARSTTPPPTLAAERALGLEGGDVIVGLDEVGRGAWAGPLVVGAVALRWPPKAEPEGIADSKLLSPRRREALIEPIRSWADASSVGSASNEECDALGMTEATALAILRALGALELDAAPSVLLLDGVVDPLSHHLDFAPFAPARVITMAGADRTSTLVAAASVFAKVTRDAEMVALDASFPAYGFASNKGYPCGVHRMALLGYGLTSVHRRTWRYTEDWVIGSSAQDNAVNRYD